MGLYEDMKKDSTRITVYIFFLIGLLVLSVFCNWLFQLKDGNPLEEVSEHLFHEVTGFDIELPNP